MTGFPRPQTVLAWARCHRSARRFALLALIGVAGLGSCAKSAGESAGPSCNEELQATGEGLPVAPGIAIAVSYQIEVAHPELGRVVDAAVEYHYANPQYLDLDTAIRDDDDPLIGGGEFSYIGALLALAERPDLANEEILGALEQAAREGGMPGVGNTITQATPGDPAPFGGHDFGELQALVRERRNAVEDSELEPLPAPACKPPDDQG